MNLKKNRSKISYRKRENSRIMVALPIRSNEGFHELSCLDVLVRIVRLPVSKKVCSKFSSSCQCFAVEHGVPFWRYRCPGHPYSMPNRQTKLIFRAVIIFLLNVSETESVFRLFPPYSFLSKKSRLFRGDVMLDFDAISYNSKLAHCSNRFRRSCM